MATGFEISRPKGKGSRRDVYAKYKIFVDGTAVTSLKEGESFLFETDPGDHELYAKIQWVQTPPVRVQLSLGEVVRFSVKPGGKPSAGLRQALFTPQDYLVMERL